MNNPILPLLRSLHGPAADFVYQIVLQPTSFCPAGCIYCYLAESDLAAFNVMSADIRSASVDAIHQLLLSPLSKGKVRVLLRGGEPLAAGAEWLREFLRELYEPDEVTTENVKVSIQTNGWYLNEQFLEIFSQYNVEVGLSLDGPQRYCEQRVDKQATPLFPKIIRAAELLKSQKYPYVIISVVSSLFEQFDAAEYLDFFQEYAPLALQINVEELKGTHLEGSTLTSAESFWSKVYQQYKGSSYSFRILAIDQLEERIASTPSWLARRPWSYLLPLTELDLNPVITHTGDVLFLSGGFISAKPPEERSFVVGTLTHDSILEIVSKARFQSWYLSQFREGLLECRKCPAFALCGGGYSDARYAEHGTLSLAETTSCRTSVLDLVSAVRESNS